jgi:prepilin-type N-terminal cleavage/methylation domain-containing protein
MTSRRRAGYTLLEVLLALALSSLLLAGLYYAIKTHISLADAGREAVSNSTLTRAVFFRLANDVSACLTLVDPNRYRDLAEQADAALASAASGVTGGMTGSTAGGMTGSTAGGMTGSTAGGMTGSTAGGMTGSTAGGMTGSTAGGSATGGAAAAAAASLPRFPLGLIGDATTLHLFVSKVPLEVYGRPDRPAELTSDLRRISYWIGQNGGLCRAEVKLITSENACTPAIPDVNEDNCILAPEVVSLELSYFDGQVWLDQWDSTANIEEDGETFVPAGPPRAVAIKIGYLPPGAREGQVRYQRHVVAIPSANGKQEEDQ